LGFPAVGLVVVLAVECDPDGLPVPDLETVAVGGGEDALLDEPAPLSAGELTLDVGPLDGTRPVLVEDGPDGRLHSLLLGHEVVYFLSDTCHYPG
jgi:hypothetical protein